MDCNLFLVSPRLFFRLIFSVLFVSDWCPQVGNEEWVPITYTRGRKLQVRAQLLVPPYFD